MKLVFLLIIVIVFGAVYMTQSSAFKEVPVTVHIVKDTSGLYTSSRSQANVEELFKEVNRIWEPAGIKFSIKDFRTAELEFGDIPKAINGNYTGLEGEVRPGINVFFVQSLNNINGLALPTLNSALIADHTSVNDFRTIAHELGHLLGLKHVSSPDKLMARGKNGELLSEEEIETARDLV